MADSGSAGGKLTPKQERAIRALLTSKNVGEAAAAIGVSERTLYRWLTDPAFRAALSVAEGDLLDAATRRLLTLQDDAIGAFEDVLTGGPDVTDTARLRAAQAVLDYLLKLREMRSVEERLTALEAKVRGDNGTFG